VAQRSIAFIFMLIALHPATTKNSVTTVHTDFPVFLDLDDLTFCAKINGWEFFNHKHTKELFAVSKN